MAQKKIERLDTCPEWFTGKTITRRAVHRPNLDRPILGQVAPEFAQIFTVIVDQDQNRVSGILFHVVFKVGKNAVQPILKGLDVPNQRDFV